MKQLTEMHAVQLLDEFERAVINLWNIDSHDTARIGPAEDRLKAVRCTIFSYLMKD